MLLFARVNSRKVVKCMIVNCSIGTYYDTNQKKVSNIPVEIILNPTLEIKLQHVSYVHWKTNYIIPSLPISPRLCVKYHNYSARKLKYQLTRPELFWSKLVLYWLFVSFCFLINPLVSFQTWFYHFNISDTLVFTWRGYH